MPRAPGDKLGPYEILGPLGAGGMGEVYQAHDPRLGRRVAIKVLGPRLLSDPTARERLRREAKATAALDHPFICKVFEIGEESDQLYIVMEFVPGQTLEARIAAGTLSTADGLRFAGEVAEAIEEAHSKRFVHRDLKPSNIMLTPQGRVKVMDFGLAKRLGDTPAPDGDGTVSAERAELTMHGTVLGTPNYMAPEQVRGEALDQRSDLFSFGILLCEMLGSPHPFRKPNSADTMAAILREPPNLAGNLPPGLMVLIRRLLAKAPADRYQTMGDLRADLARLATAPLYCDDPKADNRLPLIGRDFERAELLRALDQALAGKGSLVMVGGEPGIGKTHLTTAILDEGRRRGCFSLTGHCYEGEGAVSYVPFIEMLEHSAQVAPQDTFRQTLGEAASEIARLMPELRTRYADIPPAIQLPPEQQRRYLFNAYRGFVERSARLTPIVAVFEDLHWADEPTLQLLLHMAQSVATVPMLLIGTYRDVELDVERPFASTLETLARQKLATRIALRRLPVGGVEAMLGAMSGQVPPPSLARTIFAETEGNPFFVEEVFRHLAEEGKLFDESGHWIPDLRVDRLEVPEGVRLVIGKRLKRLSEESRRVLTTAAVIGRGFSLGLLQELESTRPDASLEAVEEAELTHLVTAEGAGRDDPRYRFVHELIRQTLAEALSLPRRQRLHARIAEAMERFWAASPDKEAPAIAHHLYQAGAAADSEKTLRYLLRAAHIAHRLAAHEDALVNLDNAVSLLDGVGSASLADIEERRAGVLRSLGRSRESVSAYEAAITGFLAAGEPVRAAAASLPLAWFLGWSGNGDQCIIVSQRALSLLGDRDWDLRARILSGMATAQSAWGLTAAALRTVAEVDALGVSDRDTELANAHTYMHAGQIQRAIEANERAFRGAQASGDPWFIADRGAWGVYLRVYTGPRTDDVDVHLERSAAIGHQFAIWCCRACIDLAALFRADFESAAQSIRESIAHAESFQTVWRFCDHCGLASVHDARDEDAAMEDAFRQAIALEPPRCHGSGLSAAFLFRARAARGDTSALDVLHHPSISMPVPGEPNPLSAYIAAVCAAEGLASLGHTAESAGLLPAVEEFLGGGAEYSWLRSTRTAAGIAAACAREWSRAEEHHRAAIYHADTAPARIFQPVSREWYAAMLAARGDMDRARSMLAEALALYGAIGMPGYARRASERLAAMAR